MDKHRYEKSQAPLAVLRRLEQALRDARAAYRDHIVNDCNTCTPDEICIVGERLGQRVVQAEDALEPFGDVEVED